MSKSIVWSEGMFLAPQHFQHQQLHLQAYVNEVAQLDLYHGDFGISELKINQDILNIGKLGLRKAAGVFPDRLFFRLGQEVVLDIADGTVDEIILLAVPLAVFGTAQYGDGQDPTRMVKSRTDLHDLNDISNEPVDAEIAETGARLMPQSAETSGYTTIPVARVLEKTTEGRVILDRSFIPHVLRISASGLLMERLEETVSLLRLRASNAAGRISNGSNTRSDSSLMFERQELQVLNRGLITLQNTLHSGHITPRALWGQMASLAAELDAASGVIAPENAIYVADDMAKSFEAVLSDLRKQLVMEKPASVIALNWNTELFERRRLLRLIVPARVLGENRRPVLALSGPDGDAALSELGPLACKLAGLSAMPELVSRGLTGVDLKPLAVAPPELRSRADAAFFTIDTNSPHWQRFLEKREALALHVDERINTVGATLYMLGQT